MLQYLYVQSELCFCQFPQFRDHTSRILMGEARTKLVADDCGIWEDDFEFSCVHTTKLQLKLELN